MTNDDATGPPWPDPETGHEGGHPRWNGTFSQYQGLLRGIMQTHFGIEPVPGAWVLPTCGEPWCRKPEHLTVKPPIRLAYPDDDRCCYCGCVADTIDPLPPGVLKLIGLPWVVPCCTDCARRLSDCATPNIARRRQHVHNQLRLRYGATLSVADPELPELERLRELNMVSYMYLLRDIRERGYIQQRLDWPLEGLGYDAGALRASGIEQPGLLGLLDLPTGESANPEDAA